MFPAMGFDIYSGPSYLESVHMDTNPFTRSLAHEQFLVKDIENGFCRGNFYSKPHNTDTTRCHRPIKDGRNIRFWWTRVQGSNGTYSSEYRIYGSPSKEISSFMYRKYMDWKNEINEKKKEEISKKLDSFKGILGKSIDRDMKLDQLLGNEND